MLCLSINQPEVINLKIINRLSQSELSKDFHRVSACAGSHLNSLRGLMQGYTHETRFAANSAYPSTSPLNLSLLMLKMRMCGYWLKE